MSLHSKLFILLLGVALVWADCILQPGTTPYPSDIPNPTGTITFDDLGFSTVNPWTYNQAPLTVYNANGITAVVTSPGGGAITKGVTGFSAGGSWDNQYPWSTNDGNIGYYAQYNMKITFTPPIYSFSMRMAGSNSYSLVIYDADGNEISCHNQFSAPTATNGYTTQGFAAVTPIASFFLNGYLVADRIQFGKD